MSDARDPYGKQFDLTGLVALVTGGGRGIGRGATLSLARQGADVAIVYSGHPAAAEETRDLLVKMGRRAIVVHADVSERAQVEAAVRETVARLGRIDILVNNAGIISTAPFTELTEPDWERVLDVNLKGQFLVAQCVAREMIRAGRGGRIVNVASIGSGGVGVGFSGISHYTASKGGVLGLTESMALELAPHGITVNAVCPGAIDTDMAPFSKMPPETAAAAVARVPLKRPGTPQEVGAMIAFLATKEAAYCTGGAFYVDGGWLAG